MTTAKLVRVLNKDLSYNETDKATFHKEAKSVLRKVAKAMGLEKGEFDLRSNKGGIAVSGEVTLHSDNAYIQVSQSMGRPTVLYRSCNGRKDYSGGQNQYVDVSALLDDSTISKFKSL